MPKFLSSYVGEKIAWLILKNDGILPDAIVKLKDVYLSLGHLSEHCLLVDNAAVRHRVSAQGCGTLWLSRFLSPYIGKSYPLPFHDRRTMLF